jgi:alpha-galactosidase
MKINSILISVFFLCASSACTLQPGENNEKTKVNFEYLAPSPPMGWNSWDCLGLDANEMHIKAVADYMSVNLKKYGWEYIVIDAGWYHPKELITSNSQIRNPAQNLDSFGRLIPDTIKYPSARGGVGFKALAAYIHSKGLKFGIHVMRGIPWNAVAKKTPVKGTAYDAAEIADISDTCAWSNIMKGVNMQKSGAQEYYNTVYELYASWGVDFVKVDDISMPYHAAEIEGIHKAIVNANAPIVLSLSPGPAPTTQWQHLAKNAHMWRISGDFWDEWKWLKRNFSLCARWDSVHTPGHWPDADMLPIGKLRKTGGDAWIAAQLGSTIAEVTNEYSRFTDTEKYTLFTLYAIFRSPLMIGGYLPENDPVTYKIITNPEVIAVNQHSDNNHQVRNEKGLIVWMADMPASKAKYVAFFNVNDGKPAGIKVNWKELGINGEMPVRDLWAEKDLGLFKNEIAFNVEAHGCVIVKIGR